MKASRIPNIAALLATALAFATPARAQDSAGPVLSLAEALRLAHENSPIYRQVLNDPEVDEANRRAALSSYFPTPTLSLTTAGGPTRTASPDSSIFVRSSRTGIGFGLDMMILDDGSRRNELRSTSLGAELTDIRTELAGIALRTLVTQRYYAAVLADRGILLEERQLETRRSNFADMQDRFRIARATQIDVMVAELAVSTAANTLERARDEARKRKLELLETIGVRIDREIRVDTIVPQTLDPALLTTDSLLTIARRLNQDLRQTEVTLDQRGIDARFARTSRWRPTVRASASYNRAITRSSYDAFLRPDLPNSIFAFSLSAGYDFPQWFRSSATVVSREAALTDQQLALRAQALRIERQLRSQLIDLQAAARDLALAERDARTRREVISIADEQLRAGTLAYFQYQTYLDQAAQAERAVLQRRLGVISAQLALEETVGAPLRP